MDRVIPTIMIEVPRDWVSVVGERDARGWVRGVWVVLANGARVVLPMPTDDRGRPLSDGFEWGYSGTGPHALAVALYALGLGIHTPENAESLVRAASGRVATFRGAMVASLDNAHGFIYGRMRLVNAARLHRLSPAETRRTEGEVV